MPIFPNGWNFDPPVGPGGPPDIHNEFFPPLTEGGAQLRVEDFELIPVGTLGVSSGILDGTGITSPGSWNVVDGTMVRGVRHSQINSTSNAQFMRGIAHDSSGFATYHAAFSMSATPAGNVAIMAAHQANNIVAQVALTAAGNFNLRNVTSLDGTTYPFTPGKIYQLIWEVDHAGSTQRLMIHDEYGLLLGTISAVVTTAAKRGLSLLRFGMMNNPSLNQYTMHWDNVGVLTGQGQTVSPVIRTNPGSPAWLLTPPGQVTPGTIPVEDPFLWWTWDAGVPVSASNAATGSGSLELSGSGVVQATAAGTGSLTLSGTGTAVAAATGSGSLTLSATGTAQAAVTGTGSLTLSATGTAQAASSGSASLTLSGSGTPQAATTGSGSLTLSGSGSTSAVAAGSGSLALSGSGVAATPVTGAGSITLSATGTAQAATNGTASLTLTGSGSGVAATTGSGSLELSGSGSTSAPITATASLVLSATGTATSDSAASGTASLTLSGSGVTSAVATASAALTLSGSGTAQVTATGTGSLTLSGSGSTSAPVTGSGSLALSGSGVAAAPVTGSGSITFSGTGTAQAAANGTATLTLSGSGTARATLTGAASITLTGTAAMQAVATAAASITLAATGTALIYGAITGSASEPGRRQHAYAGTRRWDTPTLTRRTGASAPGRDEATEPTRRYNGRPLT